MQKRCCKLSPQDQPRKRHFSTQSLGVCAATFFLETYKRINNWTVLKLPSWLIGARFKRYAQEWYPLVLRSVKNPYNKVKRELVRITGSQLSAASKMCLFRLPARQLPASPQTPYRTSTRIQPRKTYGLPALSQEPCIWQVSTQ